VLELLARRRELQALDRARIAAMWAKVVYEGEAIDSVFTTLAGTLMLRQRVDKAIRTGATRAGIDPTNLGTHTGRRSVVTNLYASGTFELADVARFVGHSDVATTRGNVQHEGERPLLVSRKALELLDPQ
jgi:site-specific recombinase XerD